MHESAQPGKRVRAGVIRYLRDSDTRPEFDDALIDAWLLRKFPGRTLDELDCMDWFRFQRATEAQHLIDLEAKLTGYHSGNLKDSDLSEAEWAEIRDNDLLLEAMHV